MLDVWQGFEYVSVTRWMFCWPCSKFWISSKLTIKEPQQRKMASLSCFPSQPANLEFLHLVLNICLPEPNTISTMVIKLHFYKISLEGIFYQSKILQFVLRRMFRCVKHPMKHLKAVNYYCKKNFLIDIWQRPKYATGVRLDFLKGSLYIFRGILWKSVNFVS